MFKVICVTCRSLAGASGDDFWGQMKKICSGENLPDRVILREKDLDRGEYFSLAKRVKEVCGNVPLSIHSHLDMGEISRDIHVSFPVFMSGEFQNIKGDFGVIGVSVHSVPEAAVAAENGAGYLIAGHIFETDCKKNLPPRGIGFLREICGSVHIPVYAIGGITPHNSGLCAGAGAAGVCVMSSLMRTDVPGDIIGKLREADRKCSH